MNTNRPFEYVDQSRLTESQPTGLLPGQVTVGQSIKEFIGCAVVMGLMALAYILL